VKDIFKMIKFCVALTLISSQHAYCLVLESTNNMRERIFPISCEISGWSKDVQAHFLAHYWQKAPVLVRSAVPVEYVLKITKNDLFDLSLSDDVESKLVQRVDGIVTKSYGPFTRRAISSLPNKDWTLLIQEVDRHIPSVSDMWDIYFDLVPNWRRDDVMISYAKPGGGIGAHIDDYDVFLLQGRCSGI